MTSEYVLQQTKEVLFTKKTVLSPTSLYEEAARRLEELKKVEAIKEKSLNQAPKGKIKVVNNRNHCQYYLRMNPEEKTGQYISKSDTRTIKLYLQKQYDEKVLRALQSEIHSLENFLNHTLQTDKKIKQIYSMLPEEVKPFLNPLDYSDADSIIIWNKITSNQRNTFPLDNDVVYITNRGERVRSKSELNIANALYAHNIPYKYEFPLYLGPSKVVFPDFTVLNVKERKEYYWEHRGLMDNIEYSKRAIIKNKDYIKHKIIAGKRLIITEEASTVPLGTDEIEKVIEEFFL